jgi:YidC/Oxa1 family membrane protein insertase
MDNVRLFLLLALAFTGMLLYQSWQEDYGPRSVVSEQSNVGSEPSAVPDTPSIAAPDGGALPLTSDQPAAPGARLVQVRTDKLWLKIDTRGGSIVEAKLADYPVSVNTPDIKFQLMGTNPKDFFIAQSGLLGSDKTRAPTHEAVYQVAGDRFDLADGQDSMSLDLVWTSADGVKVIKRFTFTRGSHKIGLSHIVENGSDTAWAGRDYRQLQRGEPADSGNAFMYTYTGGAIYSQVDKYQKYNFSELAEGKLDRDTSDGWVAMIQHYFLAAIVPPRGETSHFYGKSVGDSRYVIGSYGPPASVAPGASHSFAGDIVIGPKLQDELAGIAQGLDLTVDYGWLTVIAQPTHWVLGWIHNIVGNWGWTIIIFTILIKGVFFKLSETSYRSMANMRKLGPRIQALKDRFGDDKQRMQQAMMEMYKTEKINPLGGCLPMLVQIPFFISLYWVLLESVEMRQAPWILWFNDLSIKDPYFVLPLLMGITMFAQQKLNPAPPDPMQAKIMMALPVVFTAMFAFFPSGLVLYWFVNNLLSIAQQYVITRRIEQGAKD